MIGRRNKTRGGGGRTQKKYKSSRQKHKSTSNKRWGGRARNTVGLKRKVRHKEAVENEREGERQRTEGKECVKKKGVLGNLCSGETMKHYTPVWQSLLLCVGYKVAAVLLLFPPFTVLSIFTLTTLIQCVHSNETKSNVTRIKRLVSMMKISISYI